jgi:hypothetical protein
MSATKQKEKKPRELGELRIYDLQEIYEKIGLTPLSARKFIKAGQLKARKIGSTWFVTEDALKEFFESGNIENDKQGESKS